jgi:CDP-diacylglycerol--glycerol-3-phosphate 3-phosphatidyltransferase
VVAASQGMNVAASSLGKWKTGLQITAVAFLLMDYFPERFCFGLPPSSLYSGYDYTKAYMESSKA